MLRNVENADIRYKQVLRILGKLPTVAAFCYRHRIGRPFNYPNADLGYAENFLYMLDYMNQTTYAVNPVLAKALDILFILHADHEQNASTSVMRSIGSAYADPYSAMAGAAAALFGPRHGGANEAVVTHAGRDRRRQERAGVCGAGQEGRVPADGLWPSRLQELRPARPHHQEGRLRRL